MKGRKFGPLAGQTWNIEFARRVSFPVVKLRNLKNGQLYFLNVPFNQCWDGSVLGDKSRPLYSNILWNIVQRETFRLRETFEDWYFETSLIQKVIEESNCESELNFLSYFFLETPRFYRGLAKHKRSLQNKLWLCQRKLYQTHLKF